jgi:uncharacterized membrane protein
MRFVFILFTSLLSSCGGDNLDVSPTTNTASNDNNLVHTPTTVNEDSVKPNPAETIDNINTAPTNNSFCQVQNIFENNCIGCHSSGGRKPDLSKSGLKSTVNATYNIDKYWIKSGSTDSSKVYREIESGGMPKNANALSSLDVALVGNWIKEGAHMSECP